MAAGPNTTKWVFCRVYAIFNLASGTVLGRGNLAPRCGLDAAQIPEFANQRHGNAKSAQ
jgi:hypothetical protein